MKNPLADVIRQASGSDHALSDSGSFDTRNSELGPTANDEDIEKASTEELELLESTGAIVLDGGTVAFEQLGVESKPNETPASTDESTGEFVLDPERAPFAARFAPLVTLVFALVVALGWSAYASLDAYTTQSSMGMGMEDMPVQVTDSIAGTVHIEGAERFPFIDTEARADEGDTP